MVLCSMQELGGSSMRGSNVNSLQSLEKEPYTIPQRFGTLSWANKESHCY